ncbi:MAG: hypothetical protein DRP65_03945 [Planctomycetota bacterium]|nr:MAG: hypothetical protein DRP65_03945 [Planctomycetota bacterium]
MRYYRYIFATLFPLIALGVILAVVSACTDVGPAVAVTGMLLAITALVCLAVFCVRFMTCANQLVDMLKNEKLGHIKMKRASGLGPLAEAIVNFATAHTERADRLESARSDMSLQLQLLKKEKQNIEEIIFSIRDGVIVTDAFDRLILANNAAQKLFIFDAAAVGTRTIGEFISHTEFVKLITHSRRSGLRHVKHELTFDTDGRTRIFDCIISCVRDEQDVTSGVVAVLHDITREREISRMKNEFVSHVSHELKTPLASINAYAEMLVDGEAQDEDTLDRFCLIIQDQAQRLNRLIEDILNVSRIESGLTKVKKETLSIAILIRDAVMMIDSYAQEKNITVNVQTPVICDQVYADRDMITQVITNLLSNAVKYTPSGGAVDVGIEVNDAEQVVRVTVSDTGVGIPPDDLKHVFDKFYRVEANKACAKGTGLGLNLVKQIVEKVHAGRVFVSSIPREGTTFGFDMPLATGPALEKVLEK